MISPEAVTPVDWVVLKQLLLITDIRLSSNFALLSMQFNHLLCKNKAKGLLVH